MVKRKGISFKKTWRRLGLWLLMSSRKEELKGKGKLASEELELNRASKVLLEKSKTILAMQVDVFHSSIG